MPEAACATGAPGRDTTPSEPLRCDLLIFDLDGTLIDSQRDLANSVNATLAHHHRQTLQDEQVAAFIGDGAAMLVRRALECTGGCDEALLHDALDWFIGYYREHNLDFTCAYPGVIAELRRIRDADPSLPMAVLTNKPVRPSRAICEGLGLAHFFFRNYGGDSFPAKKPDPHGVHVLVAEASDLLGRGVDLRRTVLVGDSHVDVETARAAGILSLGCAYGLDPQGLAEAQPDAAVHAPDEWLAGLRQILPL